MFVISFTEMEQKDVPQRLYKWENFTSFTYKNYRLSAIRSIFIYIQSFSIYSQNKLPGLSETVGDWYTLVFLSMGQGTSHVEYFDLQMPSSKNSHRYYVNGVLCCSKMSFIIMKSIPSP